MEARTDELRAVSDAVLAVASQLDVDEVLQRLVDQARSLIGAEYAALGIPDGDGGFSRFLVSGMDDALIEALGALPRQHGLLGAMLETPEPHRTGRRRRCAPRGTGCSSRTASSARGQPFRAPRSL